MRVGLVFRWVRMFSKIGAQQVPLLQQKLQESRSLKSLGEYYKAENSQSLFKLVLQSKLAPSDANTALDSLFELCSTQSDPQINLISNILKQKAINFSRIGNLPQAISQLQQSISTILLMSNPNQLALSQMHKFTADLCIQINQHKKAQISLKEAQHLLKGCEERGDVEENILNSGLACIYTQMCMVAYGQKRPMEALELLGKALGHWQGVQNKILKEYELTCRLKVMLHIMFKQRQQASKTAHQFLHFMQQSPEYKHKHSQKPFAITKLYFMNIICTVQSKSPLQQQVIRLLRQFKAQKGQQKITQLMVLLGIQPGRYEV